jgi:hypothetical protein
LTAGTTPGGPFTFIATANGFSANASVTVTGQTFASWQAANFAASEITAGLADDTADCDLDGLSNLVEFALGTDPRAVTPPLAPAILPDAMAQDRLTLSFTHPRALPGVSYAVEVSGDLQGWSDVPVLEITSGATTDTVTALDPIPIADSAQRFMRIRVRRSPQ